MNICSVRYKHCRVPTFELRSLGSCIDLAFRMEAAWCSFLQQARVKGRTREWVRSVCNGRDSPVTIVWAATHRPSAQASNAPPKEKDPASVGVCYYYYYK